MATKPQSTAQRYKCNQASRGFEQKKTDRDKANDLRNRSRSLNKESLTYATGNQMVTYSSSVPNTSTVLATTLKSIDKYISFSILGNILKD
jgi:hypothetical protein